ncbi:hypothetical protein H6G52_00555 [Limnothrix sp. FACHB-881]|uniref:hypothetical protein n=1 Tax=unclassified Limnothrix TaxID=2632864 RepID=UPI0016803202|nr:MULTISPECIES: hypothetical protein [unclassified Limnothrix]MBD2160531.1 hypothetical protein [Limnothrix sp. FACHB-1083]MBD2191232.1 hypothetical protein [Limnothrix sp. FACHB-1088]MBD2633838.1 hypothetical protein [Limnothrix sp. FACHB-881]
MDSGVTIATLCGIGSGVLCLVLPGLIAWSARQQRAEVEEMPSGSLRLEAELVEVVAPIDL